jgi:hypothetical protein
MAEQLDLTAAIVPPSRTTYSVQQLHLSWDTAVIQAVLKGSDGALVVVGWEGAAATTLMISLNKANLSTTSLQKRVLQQAVTDAKLPAGTVSGTPL